MTKLEALNSYRAEDGKTPYADWRPARHQAQLDAYDAAAEERREALRVKLEQADIESEREELDEIADASDPLKDAIQSHDFASSAISDAAKAVKIPPYKTFARYAPSCVDSPCAFVHQFLTEHPDLTRKQAMHALAQYGINYSTARTQYQKWFANHPAVEFAARNATTNATEEG